MAESRCYPLPDSIPVFDYDEISVKNSLGEGSFCKVLSISNIEACDDDDGSTSKTSEGKQFYFKQFKEFQSLKKEKDQPLYLFQPRNDGLGLDPSDKPPPRYAMKMLQTNLNARHQTQGMKDLEMELLVLMKASNPNHPNVITLHGIGGEGEVNLDVKIDEIKRSRFLILDRLKSTLDQRIRARWRDLRGVGVTEFLNTRGSRDLWLERLFVLGKIISGLAFLHKRGIVYRDLKPENVGFDFDNTPKIFDFGLARPIDESCRIRNLDKDTDNNCEDEKHDTAVYKMTSKTGSPRYMSPEVFDDQPYGLSTDIYSFAILTYEVLSLRVPFDGIVGLAKLRKSVIDGVRPDESQMYYWPEDIINLIEEMWQSDNLKRPTAEEVNHRLGMILRGPDESLFPNRKLSFGIF